MRRVIRFLCLPSLDRGLLLKAWIWLAVIRTGLYIFPFQTLRNWIVGRTPEVSTRSCNDKSFYIRHVIRAVRVASRYVPGAPTCLVQALATQRLMIRRGISTHLFIGLTRSNAGVLEGHAWVQSEGQIVMGKEGHERFVALKSLGERIHEH